MSKVFHKLADGLNNSVLGYKIYGETTAPDTNGHAVPILFLRRRNNQGDYDRRVMMVATDIERTAAGVIHSYTLDEWSALLRSQPFDDSKDWTATQCEFVPR